MAGKIQTLFEDENKTIEIFPRTKVSGISDDSNVSLEEIIRKCAKSDSGLKLLPITRIEYEAIPVAERDSNILYIIMD